MKLNSMVSVVHNPGDPPIKTNTDWAAVDALTRSLTAKLLHPQIVDLRKKSE